MRPVAVAHGVSLGSLANRKPSLNRACGHTPTHLMLI
jgi:hypothetical protein